MTAKTDAEQPLSEEDKIRQQFDYGPYPRIPLEGFPKDDYEQFFQNSLVTPYYLHHRKVVSTEGKLILDAGCGSGYKALVLAMANPGAKVIGVDLSEQSINLAKQRFEFHKLDRGEFYQLSLYDIARLNLEFDYISCDETLYLLPDPAAGLRALKSVLKPNGIIRANLHNKYQRAKFYRAQELCKAMGLMDSAPGEFEFETVIETMRALKPGVNLKAETWAEFDQAGIPPEKLKELLATNFMLLGDKGYAIPDLFELLEQANLKFISMVNWRQWDVNDLFQDPENLPAFWNLGLSSASIPEKLHLFELIHPDHRLLDFWCTPDLSNSLSSSQSVKDWSDADWQMATAHLHPHLRNQALKDQLLYCIEMARAFEISQQIKLPALAPVLIEANVAACLLLLWDEPQPIQVIAERYLQLNPVDLVTLEPISRETAFEVVKDLLNRLDAFLYILLETRAK
jgi:2-polyprenyl-3-methyl-5-hydroxy-6-metoxy-1,4-benzoquinol methylase